MNSEKLKVDSIQMTAVYSKGAAGATPAQETTRIWKSARAGVILADSSLRVGMTGVFLAPG